MQTWPIKTHPNSLAVIAKNYIRLRNRASPRIVIFSNSRSYYKITLHTVNGRSCDFLHFEFINGYVLYRNWLAWTRVDCYQLRIRLFYHLFDTNLICIWAEPLDANETDHDKKKSKIEFHRSGCRWNSKRISLEAAIAPQPTPISQRVTSSFFIEQNVDFDVLQFYLRAASTDENSMCSSQYLCKSANKY